MDELLRTQRAHRKLRRPKPALIAACSLIYLTITLLIFKYSRKYEPPTIEQIATPHENTLAPSTLAAIRCFFTVIIAHSLYYRITMPKIVISPLRNRLSQYPPTSARFGGWMVFTTFTVQCWTLQLFYFAGATACSLLHTSGYQATGWLANTIPTFLWIALEVSFAVAMLTTAVVTFVLIPKTIKEGKPPDNFFGYPQQCMHNLNVVTVATELLIGSLPISVAHLPYVCLWGLNYLFFSWIWLYYTGLAYYHFLDPTINPSKSIPVHLLVLGVLSTFYAIGLAIAQASAYLSIAPRALLLYGLACSIMWTGFHKRPQVKLDPNGGTFGG